MLFCNFGLSQFNTPTKTTTTILTVFRRYFRRVCAKAECKSVDVERGFHFFTVANQLLNCRIFLVLAIEISLILCRISASCAVIGLCLHECFEFESLIVIQYAFKRLGLMLYSRLVECRVVDSWR
jgi:hypothetical protein